MDSKGSFGIANDPFFRVDAPVGITVASTRDRKRRLQNMPFAGSCKRIKTNKAQSS